MTNFISGYNRLFAKRLRVSNHSFKTHPFDTAS